MFRVMVNVYFKSQDGVDYQAGEYSGCYYETREEAEIELEEARKYCLTAEDLVDNPYIEEV